MERQRHSVKGEIRRQSVEALATRVFIDAPRALSFGHRPLLSLRHPFVRLAVDTVAAANLGGPRRVNTLLALLLDAEDETGKWKKVAAVFDLKADATEIAGARLALLASHDVSSALERLWCALLRRGETTMSEDVYRRLHEELYAELLGVSDVSLAATTLMVIGKDFAYDARGGSGVGFAAFAASMLEMADNWTATRTAGDYVAFVERIAQCRACARQQSTPARSPSPALHPPAHSAVTLSGEVYYAGGLLTHDTRHDVYYKSTV